MNLDSQYFSTRRLVGRIKVRMNKLKLPRGIVSLFAPRGKIAITVAPVVTTALDTYDALSTPMGGQGNGHCPCPRWRADR